MNDSKLILIVNPGSSSRKYALYQGKEVLADVHFEVENGKVICGVKSNGEKYSFDDEVSVLADTPLAIESILHKSGALEETQSIDAIGIRVVAPSSYFGENRLVDDELVQELEQTREKAPLHVSVVLAELKSLRGKFTVPIYAISDSSFHSSKPFKAKYYAFDFDLADKYEIKRFGYHGLSVGSVAYIMENNNLDRGKVVVCHLGSGCSISALANGLSMDNSMGYSPLEGVSMATRSGNIDYSAALSISHSLAISAEETEAYLNKQTGLLGMSGVSSDLRDVIAASEDGNEKAERALEVYVYKIQQEIGRMAAALNGIDSIVFTATIGERSHYLRKRIMNGLNYLGLEIDQEKNEVGLGKESICDISAEVSKPVYVIQTDESAEMVRNVHELIK